MWRVLEIPRKKIQGSDDLFLRAGGLLFGRLLAGALANGTGAFFAVVAVAPLITAALIAALPSAIAKLTSGARFHGAHRPCSWVMPSLRHAW